MDRDPSNTGYAPGTEVPGASVRGEEREGPAESVADAVAGASRRFGELGEYVSFYISARLDQARHTARRLGMLAGLGIIGVIAAGALVVVATVLICEGIAEGIFLLVKYHWIADLITGVLIFAVLLLAIYVTMSRMVKLSRRAMMNKYESRRDRQMSRFGHDVAEKAHNGSQHD